MKILIVDDDELARVTLARILKPLEAEIALAADGEEAWEMLAAGLRASICCSDVMMPRLDGVGLLQRTRAHPVLRNLPFVLVSAAADRPTVEAAIAAGAAGYVLKPFLAPQARNTVERVVREHRAAAAEHFLVTRRRTGLGLEALEGVLVRLRDDAVGWAEAADANDTAVLEKLQANLHRAGLWTASALVQDARAPQACVEHRLLAVREAGHLVDDQLQSLRRLEPAGVVVERGAA